jgi:hypothetical protein
MVASLRTGFAQVTSNYGPGVSRLIFAWYLVKPLDRAEKPCLLNSFYGSYLKDIRSNNGL